MTQIPPKQVGGLEEGENLGDLLKRILKELEELKKRIEEIERNQKP